MTTMEEEFYGFSEEDVVQQNIAFNSIIQYVEDEITFFESVQGKLQLLLASNHDFMLPNLFNF